MHCRRGGYGSTDLKYCSHNFYVLFYFFYPVALYFLYAMLQQLRRGMASFEAGYLDLAFSSFGLPFLLLCAMRGRQDPK